MEKRFKGSPVIASLIFHSLLFASAYWVIRQAKETQSKAPRWVSVTLPPAQKPNQKTDQDNTSKNQRIVETKLVKKTEKSAPDAFLGAQNQIVKEQTQAKTPGIMRQSQPVAKPETRQSAQNKAAEKSNPHNQVNPENREGPSKLAKLGLGLGPSKNQPQEENQAAKDWVKPQGAIAGGEYIKGLKDSEFSALNTREFVFYSYFQRIRERLDRAWVPILRGQLVRMQKTGRTLASEKDYHTRVLVSLNPDGEIIRVQVISESGTKDLDDVAVRAFNKAGPFPNPPRGLLGSAKEIKIPWAFILRTT